MARALVSWRHAITARIPKSLSRASRDPEPRSVAASGAAESAVGVLADKNPSTLGRMRRIGRAFLSARRVWIIALLASWVLMISSLSSVRGPTTGMRSFWLGVLGNLFHAPLFGMLAFIALPLLPRREDGWPRTSRADCLLVALCVLGYGLFDELHQSRVPGRTASLFDVMTDVTGAAGVLWIAVYLGRRQASAAGLHLRLIWAALACLLTATVASVGPKFWPGP
ncbi:MAG: hypothetical protein ACI835_004440 [Planctomycetota bacterium]|jgi:hypothetical protein